MKHDKHTERELILLQEITVLQERAKALALLAEIALICIEEREKIKKNGIDNSRVELFYANLEQKLRVFFE